jgi:hypothetical protein
MRDTAAVRNDPEASEALRTATEMNERRYRLLLSRSQPEGRSIAVPDEDRQPGAYEALGTAVDKAVRTAHDRGLSVTAIYNGTTLSRNDVVESLERTKPPAAQDPARAVELARRTHAAGYADALARQADALLRQGMDQDADEAVRRFAAYYRKWSALQRRRCAEDPDAAAVLSALDKHVADVLDLEPRRRWIATGPPPRTTPPLTAHW